jgi:SAM-dependent methyltransferase
MSRTADVTGLLAEVLAARAGAAPHFVVVDGRGATGFADALAGALAAIGAPHLRLTDPASDPASEPDAAAGIVIADGPQRRADPPAGGWSTVVFLRSSRHGEDEHGAHVVIDQLQPDWPVIRRLDPALADHERWYLSENRAFFAVRAAGWDARFGDDLPAYARAVAEAGIRPGDLVLDVGSGTGRALPALAAAAGPHGRVLGLDLTPDMLIAARTAGRDEHAALVVADARRLPVPDARADVVFAAGLVQHLPEPGAGLAELARVARTGGRLTIFHPTGRAALAARHGRPLHPGEPLDEAVLAPLLRAAGWQLTRYDDAPDRFFATAVRAGPAARPGPRRADCAEDPGSFGRSAGTRDA